MKNKKAAKAAPKRITFPKPTIDPEMLATDINTILVRLNTQNQRIFNLESQLKEMASNQNMLQESVMKEMRNIDISFKETRETVEATLREVAKSCDESEPKVN